MTCNVKISILKARLRYCSCIRIGTIKSSLKINPSKLAKYIIQLLTGAHPVVTEYTIIPASNSEVPVKSPRDLNTLGFSLLWSSGPCLSDKAHVLYADPIQSLASAVKKNIRFSLGVFCLRPWTHHPLNDVTSCHRSKLERQS